MALSLKKNFGFALAGNLGYAASQYIILLIFIKLFSKEDVGQFIFAGAFATPLMMALEMQLRNFYITDNNQNLSFSDYNIFRFISTSVGVAILVCLAYFLHYEYFIVISIVVLIKSFESQLDLLYGVYQKNNQLNYVAYSRIIRGTVAIIVVSLLSFIFKNIQISLLGYLISWFALYFFYERKQVIKRGFLNSTDFSIKMPELKSLKILLFLCAPMFISIFIDKYYLNYPRVAVEKYFGIEAVAIFGSLLYFKSLGGQFIASLAQAALPKMSSFVKNSSYKNLNILLFKMIILGALSGIILTILVYFCGNTILTILYNHEYAQYNNVLVYILIGSTITFSYIFVGTALTSLRKQWVKLPISILSFVALFLSITVYKPQSIADISRYIVYVESGCFILYFSSYYYFLRHSRND